MAGVEEGYSRDQIVELEQLIAEGIEKLLKFALKGGGEKGSSYIEAPYGRCPLPTPLITEDQFVEHLIEKQKRKEAKNRQLQEASGEEKISSQDDEDVKEEDPGFVFEYGFDPLQILGEYLRWAHPDSKKERLDQKLQAAADLTYRAEHAVRQIETSKLLQLLAKTMGKSGILWGPFSTTLSPTAVLCIAKPLKAGGTMIFQACLSLGPGHSPEDTFDDTLLGDIHTNEVDVSDSSFAELSDVDSAATMFPPTLEETMPAKVIFTNLIPGRRYALRCGYFLGGITKGESLFDAVQAQVYEYAEFWTLPLDTEADGLKHHSSSGPSAAGSSTESHLHCVPVSLLSIGQSSMWKDSGIYGSSKPSSSYSKAAQASAQKPTETKVTAVKLLDANYVERVDVTFSDEPVVLCLLGDVFSKVRSESSSGEDAGPIPTSASHFVEQIDWVYRKSSLFGHRSGILRNVPMVLSWTDSSPGSLRSLRHEEEAFKQYRKDLKRSQKKSNSNSSSSKQKKNIPSGAAPTLRRPALVNPLRPVDMNFPIPDLETVIPVAALSEPLENAAALQNTKACRMLYRTVMVGPEVQLIVLDVRATGTAFWKESVLGTYLGSEQAAWLYTTLENSSALWKIISVGQSVAVTLATVSVSPMKRKQSTMDVVGDDPPAPSSAVEATQDAAVEKQETTDGASPAIGTVKQVQMQVPESSGKDEDIDEKTGLSKYSLQYILATYYAKVTGKKQSGNVAPAAAADTDAAAAGEAAALAGDSTVTASQTDTDAEKEKDKNASGETVEDAFNVIIEEPTIDEITIQLGIVILSSGDTYDTVAKQQHTLPTYICTYNDFLDSSTASNSGGSGPTNVLGDWRDASSEERVNYIAEVSVGNKCFSGAPTSKYTFVNSLVGSTIFSTCGTTTTTEHNNPTVSEFVVACHVRLQEDGKLEVRLLRDLSTTAHPAEMISPVAHGGGSFSGNSNSNSGEESSYNSRVCGAGVTGALLYKCRFVTTPPAVSELEEDVE